MKIKLSVFALVLTFLFTACKKENKSPDGQKQFTFTSLVADHDSIAQGNVTNVNATVSGDVTYSWSASAGDIFNSGKTVLFGASTCCVGDHTITCTVTDKNNNSESKSIVIKVY